MTKYCGENCQRDLVLESILKEESWNVDCAICMEDFLRFEETTVQCLLSQDWLDDEFSQKLDIRKAMVLNGKGDLPVPDNLFRYAKNHFNSPEKSNQLVISLKHNGLQVITSLLDASRWVEVVGFPVAFRGTSLETGQYFVFEEKVDKDLTFFYQIVKEKPGEVYLSVKAYSQEPFRQVTLKKDGRFLLSLQVSEDGAAHFSGLKVGDYSIEFRNDLTSKSFELAIV